MVVLLLLYSLSWEGGNWGQREKLELHSLTIPPNPGLCNFLGHLTSALLLFSQSHHTMRNSAIFWNKFVCTVFMAKVFSSLSGRSGLVTLVIFQRFSWSDMDGFSLQLVHLGKLYPASANDNYHVIVSPISFCHSCLHRGPLKVKKVFFTPPLISLSDVALW